MSRYTLRKSPHGTWDVVASIAGEKHEALRRHDSWREAASTLELWAFINPPTIFMLILLEKSVRPVVVDILCGVAA